MDTIGRKINLDRLLLIIKTTNTNIIKNIRIFFLNFDTEPKLLIKGYWCNYYISNFNLNKTEIKKLLKDSILENNLKIEFIG